MNQSPRPKMRTLAQREAERQRLRDEEATPLQADRVPPESKPRRKGAWDEFDEDKELAEVLSYRRVRPNGSEPRPKCRCGSSATVDSEAHGLRCRECYDELAHGVLTPISHESPGFGQRRNGLNVGDPSPWQENAVRDREG